MAIVVPTGLEGLQQAFATLGAGIGGIIFEDHNKRLQNEAFLKEHGLELGLALGPVLDEVDKQIAEQDEFMPEEQKRLLRQSALAPITEAMGLEEFTPNVAQFAEMARAARTLEERVGRERALSTEAQEAERRRQEALQQGEITKAEAVEPLVAAEVARARYDTDIIKASRDAGAIEDIVDLEAFKRKAERQNIEFNMDNVERYKEYVSSLNPNSHAYIVAMQGLSNPAALQHMGIEEQIQAQLAISANRLAAAKAGDPIEGLKLGLQVESRMAEALKELRELERSRSKPDEIVAAAERVSNLGRLQVALMNGGYIPPQSTFSARQTRGKKAEVTTTPPQGAIADIRDQLMLSLSGELSPGDEGYIDIEMVRTHPRIPPQDKLALIALAQGFNALTTEDEEAIKEAQEAGIIEKGWNPHQPTLDFFGEFLGDFPIGGTGTDFDPTAAFPKTVPGGR